MSLPHSLSSEIIDNLAQYAPHSVWDNGFLQFLTYMEKETNASFIPPADQFFDIIDLDCLWRQNIKEIDLCYEYNQFYRMRTNFCVYLFSRIPKKYISRVFIFANGRLKNNSRVLIFANSHLLKRICVYWCSPRVNILAKKIRYLTLLLIGNIDNLSFFIS